MPYTLAETPIPTAESLLTVKPSAGFWRAGKTDGSNWIVIGALVLASGYALYRVYRKRAT